MLTLGLVLAVIASTGRSHAGEPRGLIDLDAGWQFFRGDAPGAEAAVFDNSGWEKVDVPHDWSIAGPYAEDAPSGAGGGYLPTGVSWYRKTFELPASAAGKRVFLEFDGVMANAEVWINGQRLGARPYGYVGFGFDITDHARPGKPNVVAVKTDTTVQPSSRWYTGQGIYRHARLIVAEPVNIPRWGVFVTTPRITAEKAEVEVRVAASNHSDRSQSLRAQVAVFSPDGKKVAESESPVRAVSAGETAEFTVALTVPEPKLWDIETPDLYRAEARLVGGDGKVWDGAETPFGIRSFEFKADSGFRLNGRNVKIKGVCLHHDGGAVGAAVPLSIWERRLKALRSLGVNAIRTAHNPPSPEFLDLCDRMGFLVMLETVDAWTGGKGYAEKGYNLHFREWWERDTRDIVLRDRNHPSVILWSIGNEIHGKFGELSGGSELKSSLDYLVAQRDLVKKLDPTRPVTMGLINPGAKGQIPSVTDLFDVAGINYKPDQLLEAAAGGKPAIGTEETHGLERWAVYRDNPSLSGVFLWTGVDYLGETGPGIKGWPYVISGNNRDVGFGLLDINGGVRPRGYQRKSWWTDAPMVFIARHAAHGGGGELLHDWSPNDPDTFDEAVLEIYSNAEEVELFLNGKSQGTRPVPKDRAVIRWPLPFAPGTLKAVARIAGKEVASDELVTAGEPERIVLESDRASLSPGFDEVAFVTARVVDKAGVTCPNADAELTLDVDGPGELVALSTGDRVSHQSFKSNKRRAYQGGCLAIVRATDQKGAIKIRATADGLPEASLELTTQKAEPPTVSRQ